MFSRPTDPDYLESFGFGRNSFPAQKFLQLWKSAQKISNCKKTGKISEESAQNAFVNQEPNRFLIFLLDKKHFLATVKIKLFSLATLIKHGYGT